MRKRHRVKMFLSLLSLCFLSTTSVFAQNNLSENRNVTQPLMVLEIENGKIVKATPRSGTEDSVEAFCGATSSREDRNPESSPDEKPVPSDGGDCVGEEDRTARTPEIVDPDCDPDRAVITPMA